MENSTGLKKNVSALARKSGIYGELHLFPIPSGGNNRVFKAKINEKLFLLKSYFRSDRDVRDRLTTEYGFLCFAKEHGIKQVPKPIACDPQNGLGLYEFIKGRKLTTGEITADLIDQIIDCWKAMNRYRNHPKALSLPPASESCFSMKDYLLSVDDRLERLKTIKPSNLTQQRALTFVNEELEPSWRRLYTLILEQATCSDVNLKLSLPSEKRCLSPSDFGFHNALLEEHGSLRLIDFEYAGWDDPCKMIADFFCQPAIPVPMGFLPKFASAIILKFRDHSDFYLRLSAVFPLTRIKWCCILLNDFLEEGNARRNYASYWEDQGQRQTHQLHKAERYFNQHIAYLKVKRNGLCRFFESLP